MGDKQARPTIHATRNLTRLLVAPADGSEIGLVVHETGVEEWLDVGVRRFDVNLSTAGRVLQVLEHRDVLSRWQKGVIGVRATDDGSEHHRLVGLVLEVTVPELVEFRSHLLQFLLGGTDLYQTVSRTETLHGDGNGP